MKRYVYLRYELLRTLRNRRFLIFSLVFPLILFLAIAGPNKNIVIDGINFPMYYMTGMAAWGSMSAVISSGARIAAERQVGWTRQMRITPLTTRAYFSAKILSGYMMALFSIVVLAIAGTAIGVRLSAAQWLTMLALLLVGLIPFAVMGVMLGHLITVDSLGPAIGGITSLMALLGGAFGPWLRQARSLTSSSVSRRTGSSKLGKLPSGTARGPHKDGSSSQSGPWSSFASRCASTDATPHGSKPDGAIHAGVKVDAKGVVMSTSSEPGHLSSHHRATMAHIFQHPVAHNLEWPDVLSLLEAVATVEERHDGKYGVTIGDLTETFERPAHKDIDTVMVLDLRRLFEAAGLAPTAN